MHKVFDHQQKICLLIIRSSILYPHDYIIADHKILLIIIFLAYAGKPHGSLMVTLDEIILKGNTQIERNEVILHSIP